MESNDDREPQTRSSTTPTVGNVAFSANGPATTADGVPLGQTGEGSSFSSTATNVARGLKPVASAAETLAGYAVSLSAKGLNWLDATLAERKRQRREPSANEIPPTDDGTNAAV
jgi:hypothetical protein